MPKYRVFIADATSVQDDDIPTSEDGLDDPGEARLKEIVTSRFVFLPSAVEIEKWDGAWIDFVVCFSFEADSPAEIRSETERITENCGRNVEVFSVMDERDNVVLTEEEL